ncbi:MAG: PEP-utilizing enzyme [Candidatus Helarchaeota archaeon]
MGFKLIGTGLSVSTKKSVEGIFVPIHSVQDVIKLIKGEKGEAEGKICWVEQAGATTLGPILSRISGVVCQTGSSGSHIAIVSREYEIPSIMSLKLNVDLKDIEGKKVKIQTTKDTDRGELLVWED